MTETDTEMIKTNGYITLEKSFVDQDLCGSACKRAISEQLEMLISDPDENNLKPFAQIDTETLSVGFHAPFLSDETDKMVTFNIQLETLLNEYIDAETNLLGEMNCKTTEVASVLRKFVEKIENAPKRDIY